MSATVLLLGAERLVWYCLSGFSVSPSIFQIGCQDWLVSIPCISNWVSCKGPLVLGLVRTQLEIQGIETSQS